MSWLALGWAASQKVQRAADKLVLIGLADRHNSEHEAAFPSLAWLCEFSSLDRKTVVTSLGRLEAAGLIADTGLRFGKTKQIKGYSLNLNSSEKGTVKTEQLPPNSPDFPAKQSQKRDTDTVKEPISSEPKGSSPRARFNPPPGVEKDSWADFQKQRKKPLTARGYALLCNKLVELAEAGWPPGDMIDLAIERGWETVFAPRTPANDRQANSGSRNRQAYAGVVGSNPNDPF